MITTIKLASLQFQQGTAFLFFQNKMVAEL